MKLCRAVRTGTEGSCINAVTDVISCAPCVHKNYKILSTHSSSSKPTCSLAALELLHCQQHIDFMNANIAPSLPLKNRQTDGNCHPYMTSQIYHNVFIMWRTSYYHTSHRLFMCDVCQWLFSTGCGQKSCLRHKYYSELFSLIIQAKVMGSNAITHKEN